MKIIKIMKSMSITSIIVLISFLIVSCATKNEDMSEYKTYSNDYYTIQYPSSWLEPKSVKDREDGCYIVAFSTEDNQISLTVAAERIYPITSSQENYIEKILKENEEGINVEECIVDRNKGYKIKSEDNNKFQTIYIVQKNDMIFEMNFKYQANDYNNCQALTNQIEKSFKFNDFESLSVLKDNWNKYSIEDIEVYYSDNSVIYNSIEKWAKERVEAFNYITEYLNVQWDYEPIKIFVFNSQEHGKQFGLILGFAKPEYNEIFTKYTQTPGHELAHCISNYISGERIHSSLINEGLATHLNMTGRDYHRLAADILQEKNYSVKLLGNDFRKNENAYTLGASFVKYLIDEYNLEVFKEFFAQNRNNEEESFRKFYDKEGNILINEWMEYLKTY